MKETRETAPQREKKKRRFSWRWMTVAAVCVYSVVTIISQQNILAARRQEREDLLAREKELQNEIEFMNNDEKYIGSETFVERAARETRGWGRTAKSCLRRKTRMPELEAPSREQMRIRRATMATRGIRRRPPRMQRQRRFRMIRRPVRRRLLPRPKHLLRRRRNFAGKDSNG